MIWVNSISGTAVNAPTEMREKRAIEEESASFTIYDNRKDLLAAGFSNYGGTGWYTDHLDPSGNVTRYWAVNVQLDDEGASVQFDVTAISDFYWQFKKTAVHKMLPANIVGADGNDIPQRYKPNQFLDLIFSGQTAYNYKIDSDVDQTPLLMDDFGYNSRLELLNSFLDAANLQYQKKDNVVKICKTVSHGFAHSIRKHFNLTNLSASMDASNFITYEEGYGGLAKAKGESSSRTDSSTTSEQTNSRLHETYTSPLAAKFGIIEGTPVWDSSYTNDANGKAELQKRLKHDVDYSYAPSVTIDWADLSRAGFGTPEKDYPGVQVGSKVEVDDSDLGIHWLMPVYEVNYTYDIFNNLVDIEAILENPNDAKTFQEQLAKAAKQNERKRPGRKSSASSVGGGSGGRVGNSGLGAGSGSGELDPLKKKIKDLQDQAANTPTKKDLKKLADAVANQGNKITDLGNRINNLHNSSSTGVTKEYVNRRIADAIGAAIAKATNWIVGSGGK